MPEELCVGGLPLRGSLQVWLEKHRHLQGPASCFCLRVGDQSSFPSSSSSRTTRVTISLDCIPITKASIAAMAPPSPRPPRPPPSPPHLLASSTRSCAFPCSRLPTPSTSSSGFRASHFFFALHHLRNDFASARMFRWLSTENAFPSRVFRVRSGRVVAAARLVVQVAQHHLGGGEDCPQSVQGVLDRPGLVPLVFEKIRSICLEPFGHCLVSVSRDLFPPDRPDYFPRFFFRRIESDYLFRLLGRPRRLATVFRWDRVQGPAPLYFVAPFSILLSRAQRNVSGGGVITPRQ